LDYQRVPAEAVRPIFAQKLLGRELDAAEEKMLGDHLFWYAVDRATACELPVKIHTGYLAGVNAMELKLIRRHAEAAAAMCRQSPGTRFIFMHIGYPYYEDMLAVAKHFVNAHIDMCWSWIINPLAAKDFLKKYLVTAPANKVLAFGGDYVSVEPVVGHALIARRGITAALHELVQEGWLTLEEALTLAQRIMQGNARELFRQGKASG
jgi:predicted TIM-barrel fold metal-dependent hydrolase